MTRDDVIRMAREAGLPVHWVTETGVIKWSDLERFAALVTDHAHVEPCCQKFDVCQKVCMPRAAAAEREACAKVCDAVAKEMDDQGEGPTGYISWVEDCATAIRARSET
jgi:hypothetical protein